MTSNVVIVSAICCCTMRLKRSLGAGGVTKAIGGRTVRRLANPKYPQEYLQNAAAIQAEKSSWTW